MILKIKLYKFVNFGGVFIKDVFVVKMVCGIIFFFNRIGISVEGIGNIVEDISKNNKLL